MSSTASDSLHENSDFVVCRACGQCFYVFDVGDHQTKEHPDYKYDPKDDPYRRFYYFTNAEVAWSINRLSEIKRKANELRLVLL